MDVALPPSLEWRDIVVEGTVRDFAKHDERASRFLFDIERVLLPKPQALNLRDLRFIIIAAAKLHLRFLLTAQNCD